MKILAALDISEEASRVLDKAVSLAKEQGAELTLLGVAEDFSMYEDYLEAAHVSEKLLSAAQKEVEAAKAKARTEGVEAKTVTVSAQSPADSIIEYATTAGTDLIMLGHRSKSAIDRFLVGSVAAKVVSHAPCSVMVVR